MFLINKYGSEDIVLGIRRNSNEINVKVTPVCVGNDEYKIGIWVRDDSQGIGTLTYITEDGHFGGLGHGISDVDTGKLLGSVDEILYQADIWGIKKGEDGNNEKNKGMVIEITDPELLSKTNGIVQGMSGSPIIQDGRLIGAVTHVFVSNSRKGYGIFIENMLGQ